TAALLTSAINQMKTLQWVVGASEVEEFSWSMLLYGLCKGILAVSEARRTAVVRCIKDVFMHCTNPSLVTGIAEKQKDNYIKSNTFSLAFFLMAIAETDCLTPNDWDELIQGLSPVHAASALGQLMGHAQ